MDGDWPGPCYCPRCEARFRKKTGYTGKMPDYDLKTPEGIAWRQTWCDITIEWRQRLKTLIKSLKPDCLYSSGNINPHSRATPALDWRSGDFFSPVLPRIMQSIAMRRYTTQNVPYSAEIVDTASKDLMLMFPNPQKNM
ncbi:MAG: hypothetical protein V2A65_09050 [Candidatus Omnitrophota bacterium]